MANATGGHDILIVETEIGPFVRRLQVALDAERTQTLVARNATVARMRLLEREYTAVLAGEDHAFVGDGLHLSVMVYDLAARHRDPQELVAHSKERLGV